MNKNDEEMIRALLWTVAYMIAFSAFMVLVII